MAEKLPRFLDPSRVADQRSNLAGIMPASFLTRLGDQYQVDSPVAVELAFVRDGNGRIEVNGQVAATLHTTCQRCLQPLSVHVDQPLQVLLVESGVTGGDREHELETFEYSERLDVFELIEDELVLASPIVPQHEVGACEAPQDRESTRDEPLEPAASRKPFAGLGELMKGQKNR